MGETAGHGGGIMNASVKKYAAILGGVIVAALLVAAASG
jgi:hypothetical protein